MTMTTNTLSHGRRGSTTGNSGSVATPKGIAKVAVGAAAGGWRKSSTTLNLDFMAVGKEKIVPITEDRHAEEAKKEQGAAVKGAMPPYESSLAKRGNVASGGA